MNRLIVALGLAAVVAGAGSAVARSGNAGDSPRIVPWTQIGGVRLGDTASPANRLYGSPAKVNDISGAMPVGTRWHGHRVVDRTYRVAGGELLVRTVDGRIGAVGTSSRRYMTPRGIRVGSKIPFGACHKDSYGSCQYRWRGFEYEGDCIGGWRAGTRRLDVFLFTRRGHVVEIEFGDPDALLICF